jgi:hypothetical protein
MSNIKKTATKLKFDGMTFLHWSKADDTICSMKESASVNGVKYFRLKEGKENVVVSVEEGDELIDSTFTLPTAAEIEALEKKDLVVDESGELKAVENKPAIIPHPSGKKMKAQYLNPKTGNYVSYVRWLQIKGK